MILMNLKGLQSLAKYNLECTNLHVCEGFFHNNGFDKKNVSKTNWCEINLHCAVLQHHCTLGEQINILGFQLYIVF